jgi:predicted NAD/FAD-binding protein
MIQNKKIKIAVIGAGAAGLSAAYYLSREYDVILFEAATRLGGHAHTVSVSDSHLESVGIDMGFIVFNPKTYPLFIQFLSDLQVASQPSDMAFSYHDPARDFYYGSDMPSGIFAQRKHWVTPSFWRFVADIPELNARILSDLKSGAMVGDSLRTYLARAGFSQAVLRDYLLPMGAAIWSCSQDVLLDFPAKSFFAFWENHDLLRLSGRPVWRTVVGGSKTYVDAFQTQFEGRIRLGSPVDRVSATETGSLVAVGGREWAFDKVVIATHADQALRLLSDPSDAETEALRAWAYSDNAVVLHQDASVMPPRRSAWGSWSVQNAGGDQLKMTYYMNRLQRLQTASDYFVSLNQDTLDSRRVLETAQMQHPIYSQKALDSHPALTALTGQYHRYFCGSYMGYGFHEDAVRSGVRVARLLGAI